MSGLNRERSNQIEQAGSGRLTVLLGPLDNYWRAFRTRETADACKSASLGRLAQLGEHQLDKLGVTGSSPVPPIQNPRLAGRLSLVVRAQSRPPLIHDP